MSEFGNRMKAQRKLLSIVNSNIVSGEELFGLSEPTIDRWLSAHMIDKSSVIAELLKAAAEKLHFLANKSQEQVTEEYIILIEGFESIAKAVEVELSDIS